jgi:hypothetical protein
MFNHWWSWLGLGFLLPLLGFVFDQVVGSLHSILRELREIRSLVEDIEARQRDGKRF